MSGPMQWSQKLGRLVPAISSSAEADVWAGLDRDVVIISSEDAEEDPPPWSAPEIAAKPQQPPAMAQKPAAKAPAPMNIIALAKARLKEVKAELKRMKALEKECGELERLLEAANKKPRAVVRELKRAAG